MSISSLQPSVIHLVSLFKQISVGDVRIPAFQRSFVWKERQIVELLQSVTEGFPIGSLLFWKVDKKVLELAPASTTSFPDVSEHYPTNYVLDGMQRLSSLYGVFHFGDEIKSDIFDVCFDLENDRFFHSKDADIFDGSHIPLSALFSPRKLLNYQSEFSKKDNGDELIDKMLRLQSKFQDYLVPVVTIQNDDISRIVQIFEKINSTGTKLDPVDFMRAITWSEEFDLNESLQELSNSLEQCGSNLSDETLIKCVGLTLGIAPTTVGLLDLRGFDAGRLKAAFETTYEGLLRVLEVLESEFSIYSTDCVPYEGQLLVLFRAAGLDKVQVEELRPLLGWYWATGFNEALRGKPDHYVVRAITDWRKTIGGEVRGLEPRLKLTAEELSQRRLLKGKALSMTFMTMFAAVGARSIIDGAPIQPQGYLNNDDTKWFAPIFRLDELKGALGSNYSSSRILGNVVLIDRSREAMAGVENELTGFILQAADANQWDLLRRQFIDEDAVSALRAGDVKAFLDCRASLMIEMATSLIGH